MKFIYHSAIPEQWEQAKIDGKYRHSTREVSLETEGFIHCSHVHQLERTLNKYYADVAEIVLLEIDPSLLESEVLDEHVPAAQQSFPHIYGPIDISAVVRVLAWRRGSDGRFSLADTDL